MADIVIDYRNASDLLINACKRGNKNYKIAGFCESGENIIISLEETADRNNHEYIFAVFPSTNEDEIITEISKRYFAGFSLIGDFHFNNSKWGLFSRT